MICMTPNEQSILRTIANALLQMSEFDKGYFLGLVVGKADEKQQQKNLQEQQEKAGII